MTRFVDGEYGTLAAGEHLYFVRGVKPATGERMTHLVIAPTSDKAILAVLREYRVGEIALDECQQDDGYLCQHCGLVGGH